MKKYFVLLFACMALISCHTKQSPVDDLRDLSVELQNNSENYDQDDWEKVARKYAKIEQELSQNDYTDEELKEIGRLKGKCVAAIARSSMKSFGNIMHSYSKQLEGATEELDGLAEEFEEMFKELE